jgi:excisionase family DNA binding protein
MLATMHYNLVMNLHDLFSNTEAADHLGLEVDTFRFDGRITGIPVGQRTNRYSGQPEPLTWVYTRRMLDDYADGRFPITPNEAELQSVLSTEQAAELMGVDRTAVSQRVYRGTLPSKKVGKMRLFLRWDIEQALREGQTITPDPALAQRLADWREANGRSLSALEEVLGVSRETIRQFESGNLTIIPVMMHERILALLEDK